MIELESQNKPVFELSNPVVYLDTHFRPSLRIDGCLIIDYVHQHQQVPADHGLAIQFTPMSCSYEAANLDEYALCLPLKSLKGVTIVKRPRFGKPFVTFHTEADARKQTLHFADALDIKSLYDELTVHLVITPSNNQGSTFFLTRPHDPDAMYQSLAELNFVHQPRSLHQQQQQQDRYLPNQQQQQQQMPSRKPKQSRPLLDSFESIFASFDGSTVGSLRFGRNASGGGGGGGGNGNGNGAVSANADFVIANPTTPTSSNLRQLAMEDPFASQTLVATASEDGFEVLSTRPNLPSTRPEVSRGPPVSMPDCSFCLESSSPGDVGIRKLSTSVALTAAELELKRKIFRGGVAPEARPSLWRWLLLGTAVAPSWESMMLATSADGEERQAWLREEYHRLKRQWASVTEDQMSRFSALRDRRSLIDKDVNRTDRQHPAFRDPDGPHLRMLSDCLMTYGMYNFDLGYVQGMSDLLAPILVVMETEVDAFWCFVGFMDRVAANFDVDQAGMKRQLGQLRSLVSLLLPDLANHLTIHEADNMYFCFRWLLVWFKREFSYDDISRLWEVLWTGLPCRNFHLLCCCAILDCERSTILRDQLDFTGVLKYVNELAHRIDLNKLLITAEAMYLQLREAENLPDDVAETLGLAIELCD